MLTKFKSVEQIKASNNIYGQLSTAIFDGRYIAGQKLPSESELIRCFNVSRTTIREAIKGLEASRLVDIKRGATGEPLLDRLHLNWLSLRVMSCLAPGNFLFRVTVCAATHWANDCSYSCAQLHK